MLRTRRRSELPEKPRKPGHGWVIAVYGIGLLDLVSGLLWAAYVWGSPPEDFGFGIVFDGRPFALVIIVGTIISSVLLFAFAAAIDLAGRSALAAEEASARIASLESAIDDLIDGTPVTTAIQADRGLAADRLEVRL